MSFGAEGASEGVPRLPMDKELEVVDALAELLLAAVMEDDRDERREDDEHQDHR
jgi:hypothetical protein